MKVCPSKVKAMSHCNKLHICWRKIRWKRFMIRLSQFRCLFVTVLFICHHLKVPNKKVIKRTTTIISWAVQLGPGGRFHWNHIGCKRLTPLCRCCKIYSYNCESSPTLIYPASLFVPRSWAKTSGKWVLADSTELLQDLMWKKKGKGDGECGQGPRSWCLFEGVKYCLMLCPR